ncbi:PEP-CTERM sorting domain-containing protein [Massilia sp. X63]|uniref:PEP-CTERM sorting domain-containing protein n=1 Tax=Massilia sp. X63 TaxID=3237285 RepID=UPI0034DD2B65
MKIHHSLKAAVAAVLLGAASHAMAGVVQVSATGLPTNNYLTAGTYQGSFNLDGVLGLPSAYSIDSLSFSFKFVDDGADDFSSLAGNATGSTTTFKVSGSGNNRIATTTTTTVVPVTKTGEQESVKLSFGNVDFFGQTSAATSTSDPVTTFQPAKDAGTVWAKNNGVKCTTQEVIDHDASCKEVKHQTVEATQSTTTTTDYSGMFTIQGSLLANLLQDKALNFSFDIGGDLYLAAATLNVGFTEEAKPAASVNVPEPTSVALFGIALAGLAGLAGVRRKHSA